ncbi:hypothetical protein GA0070213_101572 [Micromonospora humi]|uniref:Uncharacterized protein n=1 Tax=Micromonospora humi TaxID=745366 RepID=A0A1C5GUC4_9ACTN|nr:hypothetical protein GA0070213_101572 [Micromonospora humi]
MTGTRPATARSAAARSAGAGTAGVWLVRRRVVDHGRLASSLCAPARAA